MIIVIIDKNTTVILVSYKKYNSKLKTGTQ